MHLIETMGSITVKSNCAVVIGGYVNGYNIIRELHQKGVRDIYLLDYSINFGAQSNKIRGFQVILKNDANDLRRALYRIHEKYDYLVIFPTDDIVIEFLAQYYNELSAFCFIPINHQNTTIYIDKKKQYQFCENIGIPYPDTVYIESVTDLDRIRCLQFPLLLKPCTRKDVVSNVFRSFSLDNISRFEVVERSLEKFVKKGIKMLASEVIPGEDSQIFSYMAYRSRNGRILNEWVGRKLSQNPDSFGVFASASNECPEVVAIQGRKLINAMDLFGINQAEFKYDYRDRMYKLMEINLRSMMWHRLGNISGVNLQYAQYLDAIGAIVPRQKQMQKDVIHFIYLKHELENLIRRKDYWKIFIHNLISSDKRSFAVFDPNDLKPFLYDTLSTLKKCLKLILS